MYIPSLASRSNKNSLPWWKNVVCYQIYPRSFKDSNNDGDGDIPGIIGKLDYLKELGIDCVWVSPTYKSPMKDNGYDISDYQDMNPMFGTMEDMQELIDQVHQRGMKILLDLVVTHTSVDHRWFAESKMSTDNDKADWFIWKDPRRGMTIYNSRTDTYDAVPEPTNYRACFGGSAWEYAAERDQYYLHLFMSEQPDLNWESPHVRRAIYDEAIGFWLEKGIDGWRIDTVNRISKNWEWPDAPVKLEGRLQPGTDFYINGPRSHEFLQEMREYMVNHPSVKASGRELMLVGELPSTGKEEVMKYVRPESKELDMVFDFDMVKLGHHDDPDQYPSHLVKNLCDGDSSFTLPDFKLRLAKVQTLIAEGGWGTVFMENHDQCRSIARYTTPKPEFREAASKLLCLLQCTLSGTQFIYQGQEIGMTDMPADWGYDHFRDPGARNYLDRMERTAERSEGPEAGLRARDIARRATLKFGRDNSRTPVQWTSGKNAGFSDTNGKCWIGVNPDNRRGFNVEDQQRDAESTWHFWKYSIQMRKENADLFMHGEFEILERENPHTFTFVKRAAGKKAVVYLNFSSDVQEIIDPDWMRGEGWTVKFVKGNQGMPTGDSLKRLGPWEGRVYVFQCGSEERQTEEEASAAANGS